MRRPLCFFCVCLLWLLYLLVGLGLLKGHGSALAPYIGEELLLTGRVVSVEQGEETAKILLLVRQAARWNRETEQTEPPEGITAADDAAAPLRERVLVQISGTLQDAETLGGAEVEAWVTLTEPGAKRNPGGFDYSSYLRSKNIDLTGKTLSAFVHRTGKVYRLPGLAEQLRQRFRTWLLAHTDRETASLLMAIVLGDKSLLTDETEEAFRSSGLSHLMAVSGLHVTLLFAWVSKMGRAPKSKAAVARSLLLLLFYGWLCAFSPSVLRGILMIAVRKTADLLHRRYDLLTGIAVSAAVCGCINPWQLLQTGFLLSYGAVLALALLLPAWEARIEPKLRVEQPLGMRLLYRLLQTVGASLVITLAMAPLQAKSFHQLTPLSVLLNVPALAVAALLMPLGFLVFLLVSPLQGLTMLLPQAVPGVLVTGEELLLRIVSLLARWGSCGAIRAAAPPVWALAAFYGALGFLTSEQVRMEWRKGARKGLCAAALAAALAVTSVALVYDDRIPHRSLVFVDVGQGDCLHIHQGNRLNALIDGGGSSYSDVCQNLLLPYLLDNGVTRLDWALVTHLHTDHFQGIADLCRTMRVDRLIVYEGYRGRQQEILDATGLTADRLLYVQTGDAVQLSDRVRLEILGPVLTEEQSGSDENTQSLIVRVVYDDVTALMTADIDKEGEAALLQAQTDLQADILKVAHHGSKYGTSEAFLQAVEPAAAVIQVGADNSYGHPAASVLEKLDAFGIMTYRTDTAGAVIVKLRGADIRVTTVR